jgi:hypothetical protein
MKMMYAMKIFRQKIIVLLLRILSIIGQDFTHINKHRRHLNDHSAFLYTLLILA